MLDGINLPLALGLAMASMLLLVGATLGYRLGQLHLRRQSYLLAEPDRQHVLRLLHELGSWTSEYSGNLSDYQTQLGRMNMAVQSSGHHSASEVRVAAMLQQIMQSNEQLQARLDAAEEELEKQTQQIASYLTEARTDGLTGLANRRALDQKLEELLVAYRDGGNSFVLALIDIDKFKPINDTYGHQAGDHALKQLASLLRTQLDDTRLVARFGGEEFAVILQGPLQAAAQRLDRFRKLIAEHPMDFGGTKLNITISIGLSEPRNEAILSPLVRRADEALYSAKNMGRNRVYYHDGRAPALVGAPEVVS